MFRYILIALALILILCGLMAIRMPADVAANQLQKQFPGLTLSGTSGSIWNGRASQAAYKGRSLGMLEWSVAPAELFSGRWSAELTLNGVDVSLRTNLQATLLGEELTFSELNGAVPAEWMQLALNQPFLVLLGRIDLDIQELRIDQGRLKALIGESRWSDAAVSGNIKTPLGDLAAVWQTDFAGILGQLSDSGGPLALAGQIRIDDSQYRVNAQLRANSDQVELAQALRVFGRPDHNGAVELNITGPMLGI